MYRHLVFFKWSPEATLAKINTVKQALLTLPGQIPSIAYFNVYNCVPETESEYPVNKLGYSTMIDSVFESRDALLTYGPHSAHQSVIATYIRPMLADITVVDYAMHPSVTIGAFNQAQKAPRFRHITLLKPLADKTEQLKQVIDRAHQSSKTNPHVVSSLAGCQSLDQWPESYGDRSKGYHLCFETTLDQKGSWNDYINHPAHKDGMEDVKQVADVTQPFVFDYEL